MSNIIAGSNAPKLDRDTHEVSEFDLANVGGGRGSSGAGAGKVTFNPFSITRHVDKASALLL